ATWKANRTPKAAEQLGCLLTTLRTRVARGRKLLRERLITLTSSVAIVGPSRRRWTSRSRPIPRISKRPSWSVWTGGKNKAGARHFFRIPRCAQRRVAINRLGGSLPQDLPPRDCQPGSDSLCRRFGFSAPRGRGFGGRPSDVSEYNPASSA